MLKKELEEKLTDQLLQKHAQSSTPMGKAPPSYKESWNSLPQTKLWCRKQMIFAELLLSYDLYQHAERILLKVNKQAEKLVFYRILEECQLLLRQVAMLKGDVKNIAAYDRRITWLQQEKSLISQAACLYEILQVQNNSTIAHSESLTRQATRDAATVAQWMRESSHPFLALYYYRIQTIACRHHADTTELQALIQEKRLLSNDTKGSEAYIIW